MKHAIQTVKENILSCFREGGTKKKVLAKTTKKNLQFVPKFDIVEDIIFEGYFIKHHSSVRVKSQRRTILRSGLISRAWGLFLPLAILYYEMWSGKSRVNPWLTHIRSQIVPLNQRPPCQRHHQHKCNCLIFGFIVSALFFISVGKRPKKSYLGLCSKKEGGRGNWTQIPIFIIFVFLIIFKEVKMFLGFSLTLDSGMVAAMQSIQAEKLWL